MTSARHTARNRGSPEDIAFDMAIGALEEILMSDDDFSEIQRDFFEAHCDKFEDTSENRVEVHNDI